MTATWDLYAKDLLKERPQDFAALVLPGARYIARRESQFQMREVRLDRLIEVEYYEQRLLINIELQASKDRKMGTRLLRYSLEALEEYELPVLSCVIYLQNVGDLNEPPLRWDLSKDRRLLWFDFVSIQIAEKTTEELRQMNLLGLLPLFILSKGGKEYEVLDEVITRLRKENESELLALTRLFAELVFVSGDEQAWLVRRFTMLQNIEDTPTYKRLVQKGRLLQTRQNIEAIVRKRFPSLLKLTQAKVENMTDLDKLQEILIEMSTARLARDARRYLMELVSEEQQA